MTKRKTLVLIDGHALAFRTFHGLSGSGMRSSNGEPTYAVYGFTNFLLGMIQQYHPDYVIVAFDIGKTFRHHEYPEYKAGRAETPAEFPPQLERMKQVVKAFNIPISTAENYEADDVIGTLARQATTYDMQTLILTGDTDTLQLVDEHVQVLLAQPYSRTMDSTLYDVEQVRTRYKGLNPNQLADLRGLKGDASDNIPGVRGIGEAGAIALLNQFGTVENLYDHLDEVPNRYRKHLEGQRDQALFSKYLATIVCDVPITLDEHHARFGEYQQEQIIALFQELEFRSLIKKLPATKDSQPETSAFTVQDVPQLAPPSKTSPNSGQCSMLDESQAEKNRSTLPMATPPPPQLSMFDTPAFHDVQHTTATHHTQTVTFTHRILGDYHAVTTEDELHEVVAALENAPGFAFDTECTNLNPFHGDLVGISLSVKPGHAWYIPVGHRRGQQLPVQMVLDSLRPFFTMDNKQRYAHNAKFDIEVLLQAGLQTHDIDFDTMIAAGLLGKHMGLKDLAFYELKLPKPMISIEELIGQGAKQITMADVSIEDTLPYAAADADMTLRLVAALQPQIAEQHHIQQIFSQIEMPLVAVLADMERVGIGLNVEYMHDLSKRLKNDIAQLEDQIYHMAGRRFNIQSGIQLGHVLFDTLGLPTTGMSKTTKGRYSLKAEMLEKLSRSHDIVPLIQTHRHLSKLISTYVDVLPTLVNPRTQRIHTSFHQMGTATGRLASSNPNVQNIPVRTEIGSEIRGGFVAAPGCTFIAADYSQIELRVLAHITEDPGLVQTFLEDQDIHAAMASRLFHVPMQQVDKNQRRIAKMTVFGIIYGMSSFGLAQRTNLNRTQSQELINAFFTQFPGVREYINNTLAEGRQHGYVLSLFGRRRAMLDLNARGPRRQSAEREAINTPIQSTAADIMKMAMIKLFGMLQQRSLQARMVLQIHDELIVETPIAEVDEVQHLVREAMEHVYTLRVPLRVNIEVQQTLQG